MTLLTIYGEPVKDLENCLIVSNEEAQSLIKKREREDFLKRFPRIRYDFHNFYWYLWRD